MPRNTRAADVLPLFFTLEGRLSRLQYFQLWLVLIALSIVARLTLMLLWMVFSPLVMGIISFAFLALAGVLIAAHICIAARRWHDLDCSAWFTLLGLVPVVNFISLAILFFAPGTKGSNRFGPSPVPVNVTPVRPTKVKVVNTRVSSRNPKRRPRR